MIQTFDIILTVCQSTYIAELTLIQTFRFIESFVVSQWGNHLGYTSLPRQKQMQIILVLNPPNVLVSHFSRFKVLLRFGEWINVY